MKKRRFSKYCIALLLAIVMFITAVPMSVLTVVAEGVSAVAENISLEEPIITTNEKEEATDIVDGKEFEQAYIIEENVERRTLSSKEFTMSDGTILIQQFGQKVHYEEEAELKEIDNTLVETENEKGHAVLENKANFYKIKLSKEFVPNKEFLELKNDKYQLGFAFIDSSAKSTFAKNNEQSKSKNGNKYKGQKVKKPKPFSTGAGVVLYNNIIDNVDLEYETKDSGVKENIIVKDYLLDYEFDFRISVKNLILQKNLDGSISAINEEGDEKYVIPAPFMFDSKGEYNFDVEYTLRQQGGDYNLTISADEDWIENKATLPVTIDPIIESISSNRDFEFRNVYQTGTGTQSSSEVYVGEKDSGNISNAYFRFSLPSLGDSYTLLSSSMTYRRRTEGSGRFNYSISVIDGEIALSNIVYSQKPERTQFLRSISVNSSGVEQTNTISLNPHSISGDYVGIGFEREANNSSGAYVKIFVTGTNGIYMSYRYKQIIGLDEKFSVEKAGIDGATAYVNKATGLMTVNCDVASINNNSNLPLQTSLVYNTAYNEIFDEIGLSKIFGNNFKLNFQQNVCLHESGDLLLYDADGSVTVLQYNLGLGEYKSLDGFLSARVNGIQTVVHDAGLNKRVFRNGRLYQVYSGEETITEASYSNNIIVNYVQSGGADTDKISSLTYYDGVSTRVMYSITFTYSGERVIRINTYVGTSTLLISHSISYDNYGNISKVRNDTAGVDIFNMEYDLDDNLEAIFNRRQEGLCFSYDSDSRIYTVSQVKGENSNDVRMYDYMEFDYDSVWPTTEVYYYSNGKNVKTSSTCFNVNLDPVSEWVEDEKGNVSGVQRGQYNIFDDDNGELFSAEYNRKTYSFEQDYSNIKYSSIATLGSGQEQSIKVTNSGMTSNNTYFKYGLTFLVEGDHDIDLSVFVLGSLVQRITLQNGGRLYVTIPYSYTTSTTFVFKNNGSSTRISNVSYNYIDYVNEVISALPTGNSIYVVKEVYSYSKQGETEVRTYDGRQRITKLEKRNHKDTTLETTTYNYSTPTYNDVDKTSKITAQTTTRSGTTIASTQYVYSATNNTSDSSVTKTRTIISTKNGIAKRQMESVYYKAGVERTTITDENNVATEYSYGVMAGDVRLASIKKGGTTEKYTYNYFGEVLSTTLVDSSNNTLLSSTNEYTQGEKVQYSFGGQNYSNNFDSYGNVVSVKRYVTPILSYEYNDNNSYGYLDDVSKKYYANNQQEEYDFYRDVYSVTHKKKNSSTNLYEVTDVYEYNYDSLNNVESSVYEKNGVQQLSYNYGDLYDKFERVLTISGNLSYEASLTINKDKVFDRVKSTVDSFTKDGAITEFTNTYTYNNKNLLTKNVVGSYNSNITYDGIDRLSGYIAKKNSTVIINQTFVYDSYTNSGTSYTTNRIKSITDNLNASNEISNTYNSVGLISSVSYNNQTNNYTYDSANRLKTETINGTTVSYAYNNNNSITSTTGGSYGANYGYDSLGRLITFTQSGATKHFRYDEMGNPTMYKGASTTDLDNLVWTQGRKLESGTLNGNSFAYQYDMNGMRYKKNVNGNETEYYMDGTSIIAENRKVGTTETLIYYIYDALGISGMRYNDQNYYYLKNTLGDIIGIKDETGAQVATYTYDAWGNIVSKSGSMADINPFRYRGYYYDNETGFYYLQTRYYDPSIRQFINADNYELLPILSQTIGQLNLFAYANNNPIMLTDETGESVTLAYFIGCVAVGILFNGASQIIGNVMTDREWNDGLWQAVAAGAFNGALTAFGVSWFISGPMSGVLHAGLNQVEQDFDLEQFLKDVILLSLAYTAANYIGGKVMPIKKTTFRPKTFKGFLFGKTGQRVILQSYFFGNACSLVAARIQYRLETSNMYIV